MLMLKVKQEAALWESGHFEVLNWAVGWTLQLSVLIEVLEEMCQFHITSFSIELSVSVGSCWNASMDSDAVEASSSLRGCSRCSEVAEPRCQRRRLE